MSEEKNQLEVSNTAVAFQYQTIYSHYPAGKQQSHKCIHIITYSQKLNCHLQNGIQLSEDVIYQGITYTRFL